MKSDTGSKICNYKSQLLDNLTDDLKVLKALERVIASAVLTGVHFILKMTHIDYELLGCLADCHHC